MAGMLVSAGLVMPAAGQSPPLGLYPGAAANSDEDQLSDAEELILGTDPNLKDSDNDGITDSDELLVTGTDPLLADTDANDLPDYEEWQALLPPRVTEGWDPETYLPQLDDTWWRTAHVTDYDGDGISDREEVMYGNPARFSYTRPARPGPGGADEGDVWGKPGHWHATDYDRDGLDATEEAALQTDPYDPDTDGDGLRDGVDSMLGSALVADSNANGVNDLEELMSYSGYSPNASWASLDALVSESPLGWHDSDRDGISDVWETAHGLNPRDILDAYDDPDGDFLLNIEEFHARSDPQALLSAVSQSVTIQAVNPATQLLETRAVVNDYEAVTGQPLPAGLVRDNGPISGYEYDDDWDGDGWKNREEILATPARDPRLNESLDTDGDGLLDIWETLKGLDKTSADQDADSISDGADDFDGDGLTNLAEQSAGTHPLQADTDADNLPDAWEVSKGTNALNSDQNSNSVLDDADDFDNDHLTNAEELTAGTHPLRADTDYDGLPDAWELANQLNPLSNSGVHGGSGDADGDGFSNAEELAAGSSPQSTASTPPATFTFKSWYARAAGRNEDPTKVDVTITAQLEDGAPLPAPKVYNIVPPGTVVTALNTAADTAALDMKALDYADDDATPGTSYDPDKIAGGDVRWTFLPLYPAPVPVAHVVAVKADFAWHNHTFDADYRRVRLEVKTAVAQVETRTYLIFTETEDETTFQAVGSATFTLPAGAKKAKVTLSDNDNDANQDSLAPLGITVALDDETLCLEPTFPDLTPSTTYVKRSVYLLPVEFEVIHIEKERDAAGNETQTVVNPGSNTMLRDEIVDIRIKAPPIGTTDWTVDLTVEPEAMRNQNLPDRGDVKMYDFGQVETSGTVTPDKTQFVLQASAGGELTIRAVFNKEGKLKIKMKSTDGKLDFTSLEYTIQKRIRKYAIPYLGFPNHDPNKYDHQFVDAAKHWGDFYSHPIDTVDRLKAISVAESNVGANVQNKVLRPHDILTIGHPDDDVLETIQGEPKQWDLDLGHPKKPAADHRYKKLNYTGANIGSTREAIKWGVLWLYVKAFAQVPPSGSGIASTIKTNPDHTWEKRNQAPLIVIDGIEEPEYQFVDWHTWENATKFYNGGGDLANPTKVEHAFKKGQHYYNGTTKPLWPIRSDKSGRP